MKHVQSTSPLCATGQPVPTFPSKERFLRWCKSAGVLGTTLAFCAGCPGAQLRPDWPADCPQDVVEEMVRNGVHPGVLTRFNVELPWDAPDDSVSPPIRSGKVTATVACMEEMADAPGYLRNGTFLYGEAWVTPGLAGEPDGVVMRFDRARTPDNREFRVCVKSGSPDYVSVLAASRPEPGVARFRTCQFGTVTRRFPELK